MSDSPPPQRDDFGGANPTHLRKLDELRKAAFQKIRQPPNSEEMARRRSRLKAAKWILPAIAGLLLISIAVWPEINHLLHQDQSVLQDMRQVHLETGHLDNAVYRNIDSKNRPYTLTAHNARQMGDDKIDLDHPEADIQLGPQSWAYVRARHGVYLQHEQTLNLDDHVVLYRNDGILLNTPSADMDLKQQIIATHDWVHAEGPFGTQDAQGAFLDQNTSTIQFLGPGLTNRFNDLSTPPPSVPLQNRP